MAVKKAAMSAANSAGNSAGCWVAKKETSLAEYLAVHSAAL